MYWRAGGKRKTKRSLLSGRKNGERWGWKTEVCMMGLSPLNALHYLECHALPLKLTFNVLDKSMKITKDMRIMCSKFFFLLRMNFLA